MATSSEVLLFLRTITTNSANRTPPDKKREFDDVLLMKLESLKVVLSQDSRFTQLQTRLANIWHIDEPHGIRWTFVSMCLELMRHLKQSLMALKAQEQSDGVKTQPKSENRRKEAPPLPADALSVGDQNTVLTTIQFIVILGICPNLLPGVGIPLEKRSGFASMLNMGVPVKSEQRLYHCLDTLVECIEQPSLGSLILSRHLGDVLFGLIQICHAPLSAYSDCNKLNQTNSMDLRNGARTTYNPQTKCLGETAEESSKILNPGDVCTSFTQESPTCTQDRDQKLFITPLQRDKCTKDLQRLLDRIYQPMVVRELLILQAGSGNAPQKTNATRHSGRFDHGKELTQTSKWLRDVCGLLLSERLMKPHGVKAVLHGVLEGTGGAPSSPDWQKCDAIAKLIANCPSQAKSVEEYYKQVSPQVLRLLHGPTAGLGRLLTRAASSVIREMLAQYPELTQKYVLSSLIGPLVKTTEKKEKRVDMFIDETTVMQCVEDIHKVFIVGSDQSPSTYLWPVIHPVFELFCFTRKGVSHLRSALQEILVRVITGADSQQALRMLYCFAFKQQPPRSFGTNMSSLSSPPDHSHQQRDSGTETLPIQFMSDCFVFAHGDGGGVTIKYQNDNGDECGGGVSIMGSLQGDSMSDSEVRALCLVELLSDLKKDNIAGDMFIYLMQELTNIISDCSQEEARSDLFNSAEAVPSQHNLVVLNLVALMCEKLGPSILSSLPQMLSFVKSTFQRGCTIIHADGEGLGAAFITETLTMALGMLSAILGGAVEIKKDQHCLLQDLLPLLETLANEHPVSEVQLMASDLRIAIATHGAVWSHKMKEAAENLGKQSTKIDRGGGGGGGAATDVKGESCKQSEGSQSSSEFDEAFAQLCDPLVPIRGHAIMRLASLLRHRQPKAVQSADTLLEIFLEQLSHDDSYIYLAAIQGLVSLADIKSDKVVPQLAREFATCRKEAGRRTAEDVVAKEQGRYAPNEGETVGEQRPTRSPELRMKLGEALVKATRSCGDLLPRYAQHLLPALLSGVKDSEPLVRASSLSNLGDVCQLLRFSVGPVLNEIFSCVNAVLKTDKSAEVRRAAVLVITLLLRGLGKNTMQVLGSTLKEMYQLLKIVESADPDVVTRGHAQTALGELDSITRDYLFPKPSFTKRIQVLP